MNRQAENSLAKCNIPGYLAEAGSPKCGPWDQESVRDRLREAAYTIRRLPMPKNSRPDD